MTGPDRQGLLLGPANEIWEAEAAAQTAAHLTERHAELNVADAYAIQRHNVERQARDGAHVVGREAEMEFVMGTELAGPGVHDQQRARGCDNRRAAGDRGRGRFSAGGGSM